MKTGEEVWKDVPDYEGYYQASTLGRIKSLTRIENGRSGSKKVRRGRILKLTLNRDGYLLVDLRDRTFSVHKIILTTFDSPKPNGYCCLHINNIKHDNRTVNLKWGTYSENGQSAIADGLYTHGRSGKHGKENPQSKAVIQTDLAGNLVSEFESQVEAAKQTGFQQTSISQVCLGKRNSLYGFIFRLKPQAQTTLSPAQVAADKPL